MNSTLHKTPTGFRYYVVTTRGTLTDHNFVAGIGASQSKATALLSGYEDFAKPNWDGDDAEPITKETLERAREFLTDVIASTRRIPEISPSPEGSISFDWWNGDARLFIDIEATYSVRLFYSPGDPDVYKEEAIKWGDPRIRTLLLLYLDRLYPSNLTESPFQMMTSGYDPSPYLRTTYISPMEKLGYIVGLWENSNPQSWRTGALDQRYQDAFEAYQEPSPTLSPMDNFTSIIGKQPLTAG